MRPVCPVTSAPIGTAWSRRPARPSRSSPGCYKELTEIQDGPELQKQFAADGAELLRMTSAEFGAFIASETAKWGKVVKDAGIKAQ